QCRDHRGHLADGHYTRDHQMRRRALRPVCSGEGPAKSRRTTSPSPGTREMVGPAARVAGSTAPSSCAGSTRSVAVSGRVMTDGASPGVARIATTVAVLERSRKANVESPTLEIVEAR